MRLTSSKGTNEDTTRVASSISILSSVFLRLRVNLRTFLNKLGRLLVQSFLQRLASRDPLLETGNCAKKSHGFSGEPDDDDGFTALAQLESRWVALGSPPQSLGEDAQAETA